MCVLTGAFVWEPDLTLELLSNLGQLGVGGSDVLQTLEEVGEMKGRGKGACHDDGSARRCTLYHTFLAPPHPLPPHHHTSYCSWKRDTPECLFTGDISSTFDLSSEPGNMVYPSNRYSRRARWMKTYCSCRNRGREGGQGEGQGRGRGGAARQDTYHRYTSSMCCSCSGACTRTVLSLT